MYHVLTTVNSDAIAVHPDLKMGTTAGTKALGEYGRKPALKAYAKVLTRS